MRRILLRYVLPVGVLATLGLLCADESAARRNEFGLDSTVASGGGWCRSVGGSGLGLAQGRCADRITRYEEPTRSGGCSISLRSTQQEAASTACATVNTCFTSTEQKGS